MIRRPRVVLILAILPLAVAGCIGMFRPGQVEIRVFNQSTLGGSLSYRGADGTGGGGAVAPCRETDFFLHRGAWRLTITAAAQPFTTTITVPPIGRAFDGFRIGPAGDVASVDGVSASSSAPPSSGC